MYRLTSYTTKFLTDCGPFKSYLHKIGRAGSNRCECGEMRSSTHAYYECAFTAQCHSSIDSPKGMTKKHSFKTHISKQIQTHLPASSIHLQHDTQQLPSPRMASHFVAGRVFSVGITPLLVAREHVSGSQSSCSPAV